MSQKEIHVNSYTKNDGTHVKEHYRTIDSNGSTPTITSQGFDSTPVLSGGISMDVGDILQSGVSAGGIDWGNIGSAIGQAAAVAANIAIKAAPIALQMYQAVKSANNSAVEYLKPQFDSSIKGLEETHNFMKQNLDKKITKLAETKDQKDYTNLYNSFTKEYANYQNSAASINRIKHASQNQDYETVLSELENYKNLQNKVVSSSFMENNVDLSKIQPDTNIEQYKPDLAIMNYSPVSTPYLNANVSPNWISGINQGIQNQMNNLSERLLESPESIKSFLDTGLNKVNSLTHGQFIQDGAEFWNASSNNLHNPYMDDNGVIINNVHDIPSHELKFNVASKLQKQGLHIDKTKGIIFYQDSHVSKAIENSKEFQAYILQNKDALLKGEVLKKGDLNYPITNSNMWGALGKAGIINTYIDENGNVISTVIDTYDFNPNDPRLLVRMGKAIQDAKMLEPYFSIITIKIPQAIWSKW